MKSIIVYYSYGGNTRSIAEFIRENLNADICEIQTVIPYTGSYNDIVTQGRQEVDNGFMPDLKPIAVDFSQYDIILLGSPVWWYTFAPAMNSFLHHTDLSGKTIYPFATNGGWIGHTFKDFAKACQNSNVKTCLNVRFNEANQLTSNKEIQKWIDTIRKD